MDSRAAADEQASETRARAGALTGLSLGVLALVAALLLARVLSQSLPVFGSAALDGDLGPWFEELLGGYIALLKMAVPMVILITATGNLGPQHGIQRIAALGAAIVLSAGIGTQLRLIGWEADWDDKLGMMRYVWPRYALLGAMLTLAGELYRRQVATNRAAHRAELERTALEKEWAEARLQVLEAQIEP
ncbi:MAG TPA: hypothetical protein VLT59_05975, partial [Steroidobacteraceae bacterium]|nr:hypothetical protein [Steroidobacteraceae bacterium]